TPSDSPVNCRPSDQDSTTLARQRPLARRSNAKSWKRRRSVSLTPVALPRAAREDRKSTRLNSSHVSISYAVFCLKKKNRLRPTHSYTLLHFSCSPDHHALHSFPTRRSSDLTPSDSPVNCRPSDQDSTTLARQRPLARRSNAKSWKRRRSVSLTPVALPRAAREDRKSVV